MDRYKGTGYFVWDHIYCFFFEKWSYPDRVSFVVVSFSHTTLDTKYSWTILFYLRLFYRFSEKENWVIRKTRNICDTYGCSRALLWHWQGKQNGNKLGNLKNEINLGFWEIYMPAKYIAICHSLFPFLKIIHFLLT